MKKLVTLVLALILVMSACSLAMAEEKHFVVGLSQCTMNHPYRTAMVDENVAYAAEHYPDMEIIVTDGQNDAVIQSQDVEDLIAQGIDLLLISPLTSDGLTDVCEAAMEAGIPVVCMDRGVLCDVTCFIWSDNYGMGATAADFIASKCDGKGAIIEIAGTAGASATIDRQGGFADRIAEAYPEMEIVATQDCDYLAANASTFMEDMLQRFDVGEITAVYAHNDEMAMAAMDAIEAAGRGDEGIIIVGMDGENLAIDYVAEGKMAATISYPYCAPEGVQMAWKILNGEEFDASFECTPALITQENASEYIGCGIG